MDDVSVGPSHRFSINRKIIFRNFRQELRRERCNHCCRRDNSRCCRDFPECFISRGSYSKGLLGPLKGLYIGSPIKTICQELNGFVWKYASTRQRPLKSCEKNSFGFGNECRYGSATAPNVAVIPSLSIAGHHCRLFGSRRSTASQ